MGALGRRRGRGCSSHPSAQVCREETVEPFFPPSLRVGSRGPLKNNNTKAGVRAELPCASSSPSPSRPAPSRRHPKTSSLMHPGLPAGGVGPRGAGRAGPRTSARRARAAGVGRVRAAGRPSRPPPTGSGPALGGRGRRRRGARSSAPPRQVAGVRAGGPGPGRVGRWAGRHLGEPGGGGAGRLFG